MKYRFIRTICSYRSCLDWENVLGRCYWHVWYLLKYRFIRTRSISHFVKAELGLLGLEPPQGLEKPRNSCFDELWEINMKNKSGLLRNKRFFTLLWHFHLKWTFSACGIFYITPFLAQGKRWKWARGKNREIVTKNSRQYTLIQQHVISKSC